MCHQVWRIVEGLLPRGTLQNYTGHSLTGTHKNKTVIASGDAMTALSKTVSLTTPDNGKDATVRLTGVIRMSLYRYWYLNQSFHIKGTMKAVL